MARVVNALAEILGACDMKKILIAGGGYADIPLIEAAKKLELYVITSGNRPDELGHRHSHEYRACDFSDKEAITRLAEELKVDAVCPCCNDFSALSCAWAAERLGLPGIDPYESLLTIMHKDRFHAFAREHGLPVADAHLFTSASEALSIADSIKYPAILKPVDMTGGKGISKVSSASELRDAVAFANRASRTPRFLVEEFLKPDSYYHNYVGFIGKDEVSWGWSDNEHYYTNPYLVWGMSTPSTEGDAIHEEIRAVLNKIAKLLNLKPGLIMTQHCVVNGRIKLIEMGRRMPGNLHGRMLELATGFPLSEWTIRAALGEDCSAVSQMSGRGFWAEHCIMAPRNGRVAEIRYIDGIDKAVREKIMLGGPGTEISNYKVDKLGILLMEFSGMEEMLEKSDNMHKYVQVIMEEN